MPRPSEAIERWQQIERVLGQDEPLPHDVRRYLWDVANLLNQLADDDRLTPEQAADLVPAVLGLTGHAIGAYREERRALSYGFLFDLSQELGVKRGQVKAFVADLAASAKVDPRQIYRWRDRFRQRRAQKTN
jgi:hypothetical protein